MAYEKKAKRDNWKTSRKDWEQLSQTFWVNENPKSLKYYTSELWIYEESSHKFQVVFNRKSIAKFKTKEEAVKFANKFMIKNH